jgi:hypothetical protein
MKTTIDNNQRVFQIVDSWGRSYFCNLKDISAVVHENNLKSGYYKIFHFWNSKPKKVTKRYLKELFEANQINLDFHY